MNIVNENIIKSFTRNENKLSSLGVGKQKMIKDWLDKYGIENYRINDDLRIDTFSKVNCGHMTIVEFPPFIQFRKAYTHFNIDNCGLTSLRGCPYEIEGTFECSNNPLTSFKFCPKIITRNFAIENTEITSFDFAPEFIGNIMYIHLNKFTPKQIKDYYDTGSVRTIHSRFGGLGSEYLDTDFINLDESFIRGTDDKLKSLGVGKKELIKKWLEKHDIKLYTINDDLTIDVGNVDLENIQISKFPDYIKFGMVSGSMWLVNNGLTSLIGCPDTIEGSFQCNNNLITTLKGGPSSVGGNYECDHNQLTTLVGCAKKIGNDFWCGDNYIPFDELKKNLKDIKVKGRFYTDYNEINRMNESFSKTTNKIESLGIGKIGMIKNWLEKHHIHNYSVNDDLTIDIDGDIKHVNLMKGNLPDYIQFNEVSGDFFCTNCDLTSLKGMPIKVYGIFGMGYNPNIKSLEYMPAYIGGNFYCKGVGDNLKNMIHDQFLDRTVLKGYMYLD